MKTYKLEKDYTKDFIKTHLEGNTTWYSKFSDESRWYKPFDIVAVIDWTPHAFELKNIKVKLTDNVLISSLRQHQVGALKKFEDSWWKAWVFYYDNLNRIEVKKSINEILLLIQAKYGGLKWLRDKV
jgi:hypothetical protein